MSTLRAQVQASIAAQRPRIVIEMADHRPAELRGFRATPAQQVECGADVEDPDMDAVLNCLRKKHSFSAARMWRAGYQIVRVVGANVSDVELISDVEPGVLTTTITIGYRTVGVGFGVLTLPITRTTSSDLGVVELSLKSIKRRAVVLFENATSAQADSFGQRCSIISVSGMINSFGESAAIKQDEPGIFATDEAVSGALIVEFELQAKTYYVGYAVEIPAYEWWYGLPYELDDVLLAASSQSQQFAVTASFARQFTPRGPELEPLPDAATLGEADARTSDSDQTRETQVRRYEDPDTGRYIDVEHALSVKFKDPKDSRLYTINLEAPTQGTPV